MEHNGRVNCLILSFFFNSFNGTSKNHPFEKEKNPNLHFYGFHVSFRECSFQKKPSARPWKNPWPYISTVAHLGIKMADQRAASIAHPKGCGSSGGLGCNLLDMVGSWQVTLVRNTFLPDVEVYTISSRMRNYICNCFCVVLSVFIIVINICHTSH